MKELTDESFENETKSGKVLVDCYAKWCGVCKMIKPKLEELEKKSDYKFLGLEIDKCPNTAIKLEVKNLPTLIVFEDGKEIMRGAFDVIAKLEQKANAN